MNFLARLWDAIVGELRVGDIGEAMRDAIAVREAFHFSLFGIRIVVADSVVVTWGVMVLLAIAAFFLGRRLKEIPKGMQIAVEGLVDGVVSVCANAMDRKLAERTAPYVGTIGLFIAFSNLTSVLKIPPPAKNPAFAIALALATIFYVIATGIRMVGLKGFWQSLLYPNKALLPFKLLDYMIKPISLSLRLFGNVFGAFILMEFIYIVVPAVIPGVLGLWFDIADGILQGLIFAYLTVIYIGEILENAHEAQARAKLQIRRRT